MKLLLSAALASALAFLTGCATPSGAAANAANEGPGTRAGNSGVEVFGTIDAAISHTRSTGK